MQMREPIFGVDSFARRHIGPNEEEVRAMLRDVGFDSLGPLIDATVPKDIRLKPQPRNNRDSRQGSELNLPEAKSEGEALVELRAIAQKNEIARSFIGTGYYDCITPPVIQRNILENPGWYTAYTPYQAEIAQGRLEQLQKRWRFVTRYFQIGRRFLLPIIVIPKRLLWFKLARSRSGSRLRSTITRGSNSTAQFSARLFNILRPMARSTITPSLSERRTMPVRWWWSRQTFLR